MKEFEIKQTPEEEKEALEKKLGYVTGPIEYARPLQENLEEIANTYRRALAYNLKKSEKEGLDYLTPETNLFIT